MNENNEGQLVELFSPDIKEVELSDYREDDGEAASPLTADLIKTILHNKYCLPEYVGYSEYRPFTGWAATVNSIDFFTVGLYKKNRKIIAFEIKVLRSDFIKDVARFMDKHEHAMALSHEFYYICPHGLIEPNEVPLQAGLMWVDSSNRVRIKKVAQLRVPNWVVDMEYLQGFLKRSQQKTDNTLVPIKYLGKEISQEAFKDIINKEIEKESGYRIEREARKLFEEGANKEKEKSELLKELRGLFFVWRDNEKFNDIVLNHCKLAKKFLNSDYRPPLKEALQHISELNNLIDEINKEVSSE